MTDTIAKLDTLSFSFFEMKKALVSTQAYALVMTLYQTASVMKKKKFRFH